MNHIRQLPGDDERNATRVVAAMPALSAINLKEPGSLRYWCRQLGVTPLELCCAVERAGSDPAAVREHLKQRRSAPIRARTRRVRRTPLSRAATRLHNAAVAIAILAKRGRAGNFLPHGFVP